MWYPFAGRPLPGLDFFSPASFRSLHSWCSVVILISFLSWDPFHQVVVLSLSIASLTAGLQTWGPGPSNALLLANLGKTLAIYIKLIFSADQWQLQQRAYFSFWQRFHFFFCLEPNFCMAIPVHFVLNIGGIQAYATKILRCLDTFFNFWPFSVVGKPTILWQKLYWDSL